MINNRMQIEMKDNEIEITKLIQIKSQWRKANEKLNDKINEKVLDPVPHMHDSTQQGGKISSVHP